MLNYQRVHSFLVPANKTPKSAMVDAQKTGCVASVLASSTLRRSRWIVGIPTFSSPRPACEGEKTIPNVSNVHRSFTSFWSYPVPQFFLRKLQDSPFVVTLINIWNFMEQKFLFLRFEMLHTKSQLIISPTQLQDSGRSWRKAWGRQRRQLCFPFRWRSGGSLKRFGK